MAPEKCEQSCKALEEEIRLLNVQVADLRNLNKELEDQIAARDNSSLSCDVKVEGQEKNDLISKLLKCHDYFCCDKEQASEELPKFMSGKIFVDLMQPPGSEKSHEILSMLAKLVTTGMIDAVYRLHLEGITLDGDFSSSDFLWMDNKKVKFRNEVRERAQLIRDEVGEKGQLKSDVRRNNDYAALHGSIKDVFKSAVVNGTKMPTDFQSLLHLLASKDPNSVKVLIRYNMSLMDEIAKKNHYLTMHRRFQQLLEEEKHKKNKDGLPRSEIVLSYICSAEIDWYGELGNNKYVLKAHEKHVLDTGHILKSLPGTLKSRKDLLEKWRHSLTHLHEHAVEFGVAQYNDVNHVQMLESCTRGAFSQFQEGMHAIGELEYPHLMTSLKA